MVIQNCPIDVRRPLYKVRISHGVPKVTPWSFTLPTIEHRPIRRFNYVQGLWSASSAGFETDSRAETSSQFWAQWRKAQGGWSQSMRGWSFDNTDSHHSILQPKPIDVNVITHHMQRYAVWFGGSMLASTVREPPLGKNWSYVRVCTMYYAHTCSRSSMKFVIRRRTMMSMVLASVVTTLCLGPCPNSIKQWTRYTGRESIEFMGYVFFIRLCKVWIEWLPH